MKKSLLIIFAKNPELGKVKTRLAATLGNEVALAIYYQLLEKTREVTSALDVDKVVYYSNYVDRDDLWDNGIYQKEVQKGADLGLRMKAAFEKAFADGYEKVCVIGSDCFDITKPVIDEAFAALDEQQAVVGASEDGGYYLLGMSQMIPQLFLNKAWSTDEVFIATLEDFNRLGLSHAELPVLNDVDTEKDLGDWSTVMQSNYTVD